MKLFILLKTIIQKMTGRQNQYYRVEKNVTATKGATFTVCTLEGLPKGVYLVLGGIAANVNVDSILLSGISAGASTAQLIKGEGRSTMQAGGGATCWALMEVLSNGGSVSLVSYGYYSGAWTCYGQLAAIKLVQ